MTNRAARASPQGSLDERDGSKRTRIAPRRKGGRAREARERLSERTHDVADAGRAAGERRVLRAARVLLPLLPLPAPHNELVDPGILRYLRFLDKRGVKPPYELSVEAAREQMRWIQRHPFLPGPPGLEVRAAVVPGPTKGSGTRVAVVRPRGREGGPAVVYLHGGGWELSDLFVYRRLVGDIAAGADAAVIFVEYDRTPEAVFPAQLRQALAVTRFALSRKGGRRLGIDPSRVAISGDSAGATLATVAAFLVAAGFRRVPEDPADLLPDAVAKRKRRAASGHGVGDDKRRRSFPLVAHTMVNPVTSSKLATPSMQEFAGGPWLTRTSMQWFWLVYMAGRPLGEPNPLQSPAFAPRELLAGLPSTLVVLAHVDPLQDEGAEYARRVSDAGVPVVATRYDGLVHDALVLNGYAGVPVRDAALRQLIGFLRDHLHRPDGGGPAAPSSKR